MPIATSTPRKSSPFSSQALLPFDATPEPSIVLHELQTTRPVAPIQTSLLVSSLFSPVSAERDAFEDPTWPPNPTSDTPPIEHAAQPEPALPIEHPGRGLKNWKVLKLFEHFRHLSLTEWPKNATEARKCAEAVTGVDMTQSTDDIVDALEGALTLQFRRELASRETLGQRIDAARTLESFLPRAWRSLEKSEFQQFSTPLPLAAAVQWAAHVREGDRVLEPTAGTGHLVAGLGLVDAREISERRVALLDALGYAVSQGDYLRAIGLKDCYDIIVTNPPWGKYTTGKYGAPIGLGFTPGDLAERFVAKNIRDLKPGGRLVAVLPTTIFGSTSGEFRTFLKTHGSIRAVIQSPPGAYDTRGTRVDSVLLVWDKIGQTVDFTIVRTTSWDDYAEAIAAIPARVVTCESADSSTPQSPATAARPNGLVTLPSPSRRPSDPGLVVERALQLGTPAPVQPSVIPLDTDIAPVAPAPERCAERENEPAPSSTFEPDTSGPTRGLTQANLKAYQDAQASPHFAPYQLRSAFLGERHPKLIVEARALAGVAYPALTLQPTPRVAALIRTGRISIEQAEQALAAVQANVLGHHGYLAADNVGVGKSRELGLVVIDLMERARHQGQPLRLMVTTKGADNITDLIDRELFQELLRGEAPGFEIVRVSDLKASSSRYKQGPREPLPSFRHAIYVVDSYNLASYRDALLELRLHGIVGDEAHRFKNADAAVGATWQTLHAQIMADVAREQQAFVYFTATPAENVTDYQYLYGLRFWPIDGFDDWINVVTGQASEDAANELRAVAEGKGSRNPDDIINNTSGEVVGSDSDDVEVAGAGRSDDVFGSRLTPAEAEQITREWKTLGRFSSRDLWRAGTEFQVHTATLDDLHIQRYDQFAGLARDIMEAGRWFALLDQSGRASRYGVTAQLQFAAKRIQAQPAIEEAIRIAQEHVAEGFQPVISLINVSAMNPEEGNLGAAINQINTREVEKTDDGFVDRGEIPEALIVKAELTERAQALGLFDNPLELVRQAFGAEQVAFVVGDTGPLRQVQVKEFQAGLRKVAVISAAGATGISLDHRVPTKTPRQGRRVFIDVQYEWSATSALQRYGRVDRASSLTPPKIVALTFGSAAEKKFLATIANRMASLGALSKGGSETTGAVALEEFEITGNDSIIAARNAWAQQADENRDLWVARPFRDVHHPEHPARTTKATMREINLALLWLPTAVANAYWETFIAERARVRALMGYTVAMRTKALRGELQRAITLKEHLGVWQVKNEAGHRMGIVQGVVMPEMPTLRHFLPGEGERRYISFTAGTTTIAGLEVRITRLSALAKTYGKRLKAEALETPAQVEAALRAGDTVPLKQEGWSLRWRRDNRIAIDGAKMVERDLLLKHGAGYSPVGNLWFVADLPRFLERFPPLPPAMEIDLDEIAPDSDTPEPFAPQAATIA